MPYLGKSCPRSLTGGTPGVLDLTSRDYVQQSAPLNTLSCDDATKARWEIKENVSWISNMGVSGEF